MPSGPKAAPGAHERPSSRDGSPMNHEPRGAPASDTASPSIPEASPSLGARAVRGSVWVTAGFGARQLLRIVSNLVMARLLFPEAFGLMALVHVFIMGLGMFSDVGLRPSIVRSQRGDDPVFLRTAWTIQVARGALLWLLTVLVAFPLARFYDQPELARLLPVVGLVTLIGGFESTSLPRLSRHLSLGKLISLQLGAQVASIAVMVTWAAIRPTIWALVAGSLTARLGTTAFSHAVMRGHRDRFGWDRDSFQELLRFGSWIFVSTVLTFFAGHADRLIFGKTIPVAMLGVYSIAWMFATLPTQLMQQIQSAVVFPALSRKLASDASGAGLGPWYHRARFPVLVLAGLAIACLVASGPWLIATLYDPRYVDAGWILQLLALGSWFYVLAGPSGSALLAVGQPRWLAVANGAKVLGIAILVPAGFWVAEFRGAVVGFAAAEGLRYAALAAGAHGVGLGTVWRDLLVSVLLALAALVGLSTGDAVAVRGFGSPASLVGSLATTSALWMGFSYLLARLDGKSLRVVFRPSVP